MWLITLIKFIYCWSSVDSIVKDTRHFFCCSHPPLSSSSLPIMSTPLCPIKMNTQQRSSGPSWHFNWRGVNLAQLSRRRVINSFCLSHLWFDPPFPPPFHFLCPSDTFIGDPAHRQCLSFCLETVIFINNSCWSQCAKKSNSPHPGSTCAERDGASSSEVGQFLYSWNCKRSIISRSGAQRGND